MTPPAILDARGRGADSPEIRGAARVIASGGIVVHPTETLYGLAVDPWNGAALEALAALKGRDAARGVILLVADLAAAIELGDPGALGAWRPFAEAFWPGPLTLVVTPGPRAPAGGRGPTGGIAIRWSADPVAQALVRAVGRAVTSTSANLSGRPPASTAEEAARIFGEGVGLILDAGPRAGGVPSTVLDTTAGRPAISREGAIPRAAIEAVNARVRMPRTDGGGPA